MELAALPPEFGNLATVSRLLLAKNALPALPGVLFGGAFAATLKVLDVAEFCEHEELQFDRAADVQRVAWQAPCTLQHGQQVNGTVERLLERAGYALVDVADGHLCCGSAGTYSVLQPDLSERLRDAKLNALCANTPDLIATANVGCQTHLASASGIPVRHWVELLR